MLENTLKSVDQLEVSRIIQLIADYKHSYQLNSSNEELRLTLMKVLDQHNKLDFYNSSTLQSSYFQQRYLESDDWLNYELQDLDLIQKLNHFEKALLLTVLNVDDTHVILIVLGQSLTINKLRILICQPFMSQKMLNNLLRMVSQNDAAALANDIEEYGYSVPINYSISDKIWPLIINYISPTYLPTMRRISHLFNNISQDKIATTEELIMFILNNNADSLYSNKKFIREDNILTLFEYTISLENKKIFRLLLTVIGERYDYTNEPLYIYENIIRYTVNSRSKNILAELFHNEKIYMYTKRYHSELYNCIRLLYYFKTQLKDIVIDRQRVEIDIQMNYYYKKCFDIKL